MRSMRCSCGGPCGPMRGPCGARLTRARCRPTGGVGPAARAPRRYLAGGPHAAAWGRMPFHTRKRVGAARPMRAHARPMRRAAVASPLRANGKGHPSHPNATRMARMPLHGSTCQCRPRSGSAQHGPCGPMRGPCGARLARARGGPTEGRGPAARTPRMGYACRCMGAHAMSHTQEGRRHGPCGPMRGPCGARLTRARCGPTVRDIPAARAPRLGPACRCMAGAPASFLWNVNTTDAPYHTQCLFSALSALKYTSTECPMLYLLSAFKC
jgi:hypothetical protein